MKNISKRLKKELSHLFPKIWNTNLIILKKNINNFKVIINLFLLFTPKNIKIKLIKLFFEVEIRNHKKPIVIIINIKRLDIPKIFKEIIKKNPPQFIFNKK